MSEVRRREHYHTEKLKRIIIGAIVRHSKGEGMSVTARLAADDIIDLLLPDYPHKPYEGPVKNV